MKLSIVTALLLIAVAASARAGFMRFDALEEDSLEGIYLPDAMKPYIMFSAESDIDNQTVGSYSGIFLGQKGGLVSFVVFDVKFEERHNRDYMMGNILSAARVTAAAFHENPHLPGIETIVNAYSEFYDELISRLATERDSQVLYSVVLHNVIVKSASRIIHGANSDLKICALSVKYAGDVALFVCDQDEGDAQPRKNIMKEGRIRPGISEKRRQRRGGWWRRRW